MASSSIFCGACGVENQKSHTFCSACGHALPKSAVTEVEIPSTLTGRLSAQTLLKQRYRVLHPVGKGGMGAVYMAQDSQLGDRLVAVKEMSQSRLPPQDVPDAVEAFKREAHLLAGLQHPNLPSIHDHFEEAGRWYLVMSFIQGVTLQEYLSHTQEGKLPLEEALQIGQDLCNVLDYLHTYQPPIIFRDLKPTNIMRTPKGHIYLIDFGIARHFKPGQSKDTASYGSAGYSPPEQYGQAQTSERSDIYSLGATLYCLLSGYSPTRSPFRLPPLQTLVPTLPPRLVALVTQMLELEEDKRPASIKVVQQELQRSIFPAPVPLPPPPAPRQIMPIAPPPPPSPKQILLPAPPKQGTPIAPPPPRQGTPVPPSPPWQGAYPPPVYPALPVRPSVSRVRWLFFWVGLLLAIPLVGLGLMDAFLLLARPPIVTIQRVHLHLLLALIYAWVLASSFLLLLVSENRKL